MSKNQEAIAKVEGALGSFAAALRAPGAVPRPAHSKNSMPGLVESPRLQRIIGGAVKTSPLTAEAKVAPPEPQSVPVWTPKPATETVDPSLSFPGPIRIWLDNPVAAEHYRIIRTKIVQHPRQPRVIQISSAASGDGKTTTAIHIAASLALRNDCKVLLIEADMRAQGFKNIFGFSDLGGLSALLRGELPLERAMLQSRDLQNLWVLSSGKTETNPAELLDSSLLRDLCERAKREFDYVIIDSPPIFAVADGELLEAVSDGVIFVVRPDHTPRELLAKALGAVRKDRMIGVIINDDVDWFLWKPSEHYAKYYSNSHK